MAGPEVGVRGRARTLRNVRQRVGRQVADLRNDAGVSRAALARCAGIDSAHLWRIEAGVANPSLECLVALSACLGADLGVRLFPIAGPRLHDRFQAPMVEALVRTLGGAWRPQPEVVVPGASGVIDLVMRRALDQLTIACECHSELRRLEEVLRRLGDPKRRAMSLGEALLDQTALAGLGNVYRSEVCFIERIDPFAEVGALPPESLRRLVVTATRLISANRDGGARTTVAGGPAGRLYVYGRAGRPCRRCGTAIRTRVTGSLPRRTYWCSTCQPQLSGVSGAGDSADPEELPDPRAERTARGHGR